MSLDQYKDIYFIYLFYEMCKRKEQCMPFFSTKKLYEKTYVQKKLPNLLLEKGRV